jgi:type I restriction enzyme S subunit
MKAAWTVKPLGSLCRIKTGKKDVNQGNPEGKYPFFTCAATHTFSDTYSFDTEALLVAGNGDVGQVSYYKGKFEAYQRTYVLSDFVSVVPRFLYLILDGKLKDTVSKQKLGNTMPYIKMGMLTNFPVPVPPLAEQQRIVGVLDEAFEGVATAKANAEKNLWNARAIFESHLHTLFTKRGAGWVEKPLAELCDSTRVITYGVIKLGDEVLGGVPCLRTSNVRWLHLDTEGIKRIAPSLSSEYSRTILRGGEVLVNVRGTLGGVAVVQSEMAGWNVSREVAVVPVDPSRVNPEFLSYMIGSSVSQEWLGGVKKGAAYVGINIEDLRLLPVIAPKVSRQLEIVHHLQTLEAVTQRLASIYQKKLDALEALKKSLLHQAFSGELSESSGEFLQKAVP